VSDMPRSAEKSGNIDFVLSPAKIADELQRIAKAAVAKWWNAVAREGSISWETPTTSSSVSNTRPMRDTFGMRGERLLEFSFSLHPEKTRLLAFGRHAAADRAPARARQTGDLQLLGLHLHLRQVSLGQILLKRKTRRDRMRAKLKEIKD
jgi:hypothetical protein